MLQEGPTGGICPYVAKPTFPSNLLDFQRRFSTEDACHAFVRDSRWPDGFRCPKCGNPGAYDLSDRKAVECAKCRYQASVTAGTIMHKSKLPLQVWLWAAWLMVSSKGGVSALELARQLDISRESAFALLHKLRHAMVAPERTQLSGRVEVDETLVGGPVHGKGSGRFHGAQDIVVGAVEVKGEYPTRIRLRVIPEADSIHLHKFIRENVEEGSTVVTDGHPAYPGLGGFKHVQQVVGRGGLMRKDVLKFFHTMVSNLKAWLGGTHHGAVSSEHLQAYLNEFAFRFNRRGNLGAAFGRLLELAPTVGTLRYEDIYAEHPPHRNPMRRKALQGKLNRW